MTPILPQHAFCPARRLMAGLALGLLLSAGTPSDALAQTYNSEGWTRLQPSEDTRFVFVSSSEGNDANHGHSPAQPVRTIARAKQLMRDDNPDWMLLRRGDTWTESFGGWPISGRSESERAVIASYGESNARPRLLLTDTTGISSPYQQNTSYVAIVGIHFQADRPSRSSARGIRWLSSGRDLLIEDCLIEGFKDNITIEGQGDGFEDLAIRRNVIVDAWSTDGHSQGLFVAQTEGVLVEENVIDRNGWNPAIAGAIPTGFNQNVYIQTSTNGVRFLSNITSRASGAGAQLRNGGIASQNLFYANPMGLRFGYMSSSGTTFGNASGEVKNNAVVGGSLAQTDGAGFGLWIERLDGVEVSGNVVTSLSEGTNAWGIALLGFARDATISNNVVYGWNGSGGGTSLRSTAAAESEVVVRDNMWISTVQPENLVRLSNPGNFRFLDNNYVNIGPTDRVFLHGTDRMDFNAWSNLPHTQSDQITADVLVDAGRNLGSYARHLGLTDEASFLAAARQLSRRNWRPELTGAAASEWIRAGYALQPD